MIRHRRKKAGLKDFKILGERQGWRCATCKKMLPCTAQIDHRIPLLQGGNNELENLQILCPGCHALKSQKEEDLPRIRFKAEQVVLGGMRTLRCLSCGILFSPYFSGKHRC